jgi:homoserine dehydrogenase
MPLLLRGSLASESSQMLMRHGVRFLRGQGAGRWATTVSVMGDLHEVARNFR